MSQASRGCVHVYTFTAWRVDCMYTARLYNNHAPTQTKRKVFFFNLIVALQSSQHRSAIGIYQANKADYQPDFFLSIYLSIYLSVYLSVYLFFLVFLSVLRFQYQPLDKFLCFMQKKLWRIKLHISIIPLKDCIIETRTFRTQCQMLFQSTTYYSP